MKILLIDPPHEAFLGYYRFYFPLGLVSIGSTLEAEGHEVCILDADHLPEGRCLANVDASAVFSAYISGLKQQEHPLWQHIRATVIDFCPDVVGITVLSCKLPSALAVARIARESAPNAKVMVGGDHTVYFAKELAIMPDIDVVVIGEGEETAREVVAAWDQNKPLDNIRGIAFRAGDEVIRAPRRPLIENLDSLPLPNRALLMDHHSYRPEDMGLMMTSRGCPALCTFCGIAASLGRTPRMRSIANCITEIKHTIDTYGTKYFSFRDGTFTIDRQHTIDFCQALINENVGISWECLTRPDCLDEELVLRMRESGCSQIRLGIETGSQRILEYMRKDTTIADYQKAADTLNHLNMYWSAYLMFGVPEENFEDIHMTLDLVERIQPSFITVSRYVPLPGTPMYKDVRLMGKEVDWQYQNNKCIDQAYSKYISTEKFQEIMQWLGEYAANYNRRRADGNAYTDRRLKTGFEDHSLVTPQADGVILERPAFLGTRPTESATVPGSKVTELTQKKPRKQYAQVYK